jgi:hypothetical protein
MQEDQPMSAAIPAEGLRRCLDSATWDGCPEAGKNWRPEAAGPDMKPRSTDWQFHGFTNTTSEPGLPICEMMIRVLAPTLGAWTTRYAKHMGQVGKE